MQYTVARYIIAADKVRRVKKALAEFVAQVRHHEPRTLYLVFGDDTKGSFVHVMSFESDAAHRRHSLSDYVVRFVKKIYPHCIGKPLFSEMNLSSTSRKQWLLEKPAEEGRGGVARQRRPRAPVLSAR